MNHPQETYETLRMAVEEFRSYNKKAVPRVVEVHGELWDYFCLPNAMDSSHVPIHVAGYDLELYRGFYGIDKLTINNVHDYYIPGNRICSHNFVKYEGFSEVYRYCKKCDLKLFDQT